MILEKVKLKRAKQVPYVRDFVKSHRVFTTVELRNFCKELECSGDRTIRYMRSEKLLDYICKNDKIYIQWVNFDRIKEALLEGYYYKEKITQLNLEL